MSNKAITNPDIENEMERVMNDEQIKMVDECLDADRGLTPWEIDFIESMDKLRDRELTVRQSDTLADIASNIRS